MSTASPRVMTRTGRHALLEDTRSFFARKGQYRLPSDQVLGGVCSGLGRRFEIRPWPSRMLFLLGLMLLPGSQLLVYPVLWVLMPREQTSTEGGWGTPSSGVRGAAPGSEGWR